LVLKKIFEEAPALLILDISECNFNDETKINIDPNQDIPDDIMGDEEWEPLDPLKFQEAKRELII
jgi:hypothetical protein